MFSMFSERGQSLKVVKGFKYGRPYFQKKSQTYRWRCTFRDCNAFILTNMTQECLLEESKHGHTHNPDSHLARHYVSNSVKRKAANNQSTQPIRLVRKEIQVAPAPIRSELDLSDLKRIRNVVYAEKQRQYPKLPKSIDEVHTILSEMNLKTADGENLLMVNDSQLNIVIFSTKKNLKFLSEVKKIFIDGTFDKSLKFFKQLFTIHGVKKRNYVPAAFCLLKNKEKTSYQAAFEHLIKKCKEENLLFYPSSVVSDFEPAIIWAIEITWPCVIIILCRFHLTQNWYKKIQQLGLSTLYEDKDSEVGWWLRWCFGLPLLDASEVAIAFTEDLMNAGVENASFAKFVDYLCETYVDEVSATYPPTLWASQEIVDRTTNICEAFHHHYNKLFNSSHPHVFAFTEVLSELQEEINIRIRSANKVPTKYYDCNYINSKALVCFHQEEYKKGKLSRQEYVKNVSTYYKHM